MTPTRANLSTCYSTSPGGLCVEAYSQLVVRRSRSGHRRVRGHGRGHSDRCGGHYPPYWQQFKYCLLERCKFGSVTNSGYLLRESEGIRAEDEGLYSRRALCLSRDWFSGGREFWYRTMPRGARVAGVQQNRTP